MFSSEISHKSSAETLPRPRDMLESESNIFNLLQKIDELSELDHYQATTPTVTSINQI